MLYIYVLYLSVLPWYDKSYDTTTTILVGATLLCKLIRAHKYKKKPRQRESTSRDTWECSLNTARLLDKL